MRVDPSNVDQRGYWDGASGEYWARRADRFEEGVADYDFVSSMGSAPADRVLDIGCRQRCHDPRRRPPGR
ncbi:MAG: hypothetical protein WBA97_28245 [Actinophytocola sp.]|uniref:hypothetical protein n=1 Tax=Actinophytocola sp. TaxID=1872138 RepID=UPI003C722EFF